MNSFERWLLKNRPYCEIGSCMVPSTRIIEHRRRKTAVCDAHFRAYCPLQGGYEQRQEMERNK